LCSAANEYMILAESNTLVRCALFLAPFSRSLLPSVRAVSFLKYLLRLFSIINCWLHPCTDRCVNHGTVPCPQPSACGRASRGVLRRPRDENSDGAERQHTLSPGKSFAARSLLVPSYHRPSATHPVRRSDVPSLLWFANNERHWVVYMGSE
jgi:hypothetical protein